MPNNVYKLGSVKGSEVLIKDLYIDLRRKVRKWATVTRQTAQARMGYIGQHLVSVVTSFPGGRSGARGKDLILPRGAFAEIKTCYRVDQLGYCNKCQARVASLEEYCPHCNSKDIKRNDDSKWLIGIRNKDEFESILDPKFYFLVLFEFLDIQSTDTTIQASIWRVDPKVPGFAYCMVDYYLNIRTKSKSKAPFNLWPYQLKFDIMRPMLIYRSLIKPNDMIETSLFPGRDKPQLHPLKSLTEYSGSKNLAREKTVVYGKSLGMSLKSEEKGDLLEQIQSFIEKKHVPPEAAADAIAKALYLPEIKTHLPTLPRKIKKYLPKLR